MSHPEPYTGSTRAPGPPLYGPGTPGRSAQEIRRDVELTRTELTGSLEALRGRVAELTDWRRQVREHRRELVMGAAVAGFVVGGILALRRRGDS